MTVSYGEYVRTEVASVGTKECAATYRGLDRTAKYVVVVTPQPSEGTECEASSVVVDLASEYFRPVGPVSISRCRGGVYLQRFDALAGVTKETDLRRVPLENWQFFKGDDETETLLFAANEKATTGGVYAILDDEKSGESAALGTLANSTLGASIGIAFSNDCPFAAANFSLTFDSIQRTFKTTGKSYVLECLVTDGETRIDTEGEWVPVKIDVTAPLTAEDVTEQGTDCKRIVGFPIGLDVTVEPGQVLLLRWRDQKRDSKNGGASPLMGIDNVRLDFQMTGQKGFGVIMR